MSTFNLKVVTPVRVIYDAEVSMVIVRTASGDVGIMKGHINYVAPLSIGEMTVVVGEERRVAAVAGGMIKVDKEGTTILTHTCEWADEIDVERARRAKERAERYLEHPTELHTLDVARIKLDRAINRINIGSR